MRTDEYMSPVRRRQLEKKAKAGRLLALAAVLAVLFCAAVFAFRIYRLQALDRPYDPGRISNMLEIHSQAGRLKPFAQDIAVVTASTEGDEAYKPGAGILLPVSGREAVFAKNAFTRMNPASTTKIMTALLAVKYGNLKDLVTVTEESVITEAGASLANIHPGDTISLEQLLYGLMLPSGNDAANAIAVHIAGNVPDFAALMNREAAGLGALGTHFVNPNGLTAENHLSTAYDLYLIMREALKYDDFRRITGTAEFNAYYETASGKTQTRTWKNGNRYINGTQTPPEGVTPFSGKTGTTMAAGNCLVLASRNEAGQEYISVVLKANGRDELYGSMNSLLQKELLK